MLLKKFNEEYARLIMEQTSTDIVTVTLSAQAGDDSIDQRLFKQCEKAGVECDFGEGFNEDEKEVTLTGSKQAVRSIVRKNWLAGQKPQDWLKDNDPDNEDGLWDLFDLAFH